MKTAVLIWEARYVENDQNYTFKSLLPDQQ